MKVLIANSTCKVGGVSTFMLTLRAALQAEGHDAELFFFNRGSMEAHLPPDCRAHFGGLADCMRLVERHRFQIVHANNVDWTTGISAVRELGARLIVTAHKVREADRTYGWTTASCDALTAVSRGSARALQPFTDLPIQIVPNGVDTEAFSPDARPAAPPPIVAWVGRGGSPLKRIDIFAGMAPALRAAGFRIWVIDQHGLAKSAEAYPDAVATLQPLAERWDAVEFHEMPELYRAVAASGGCVISTSSREGLGLGLIEAQACGCPAIGPDVEGVNEAISPRHGGVLFPFTASPDDIAADVIAALQDQEGMARRRAQAVGYVREQYTRQRMAERYIRIYKEAPIRTAAERLARLRARMRLSPFVHWQGYLAHRWSVGQAQYRTLEEFARASEWRLAASAGRAAFSTSPTIFVKPRRLMHLLKTQMHALGTSVQGAPTLQA